MNKLLLLLTLTVCFSGMSYASFKVEKKSKTTNSSEVVLSQGQTDAVVYEALNTGDPDDEKAGERDGTVAKILAVVSVVFLPLGLHNWYLGRNKQAIWQTLMVFPGIFLFGIPTLASWIWQMVDMFKLLINGSI